MAIPLPPTILEVRNAANRLAGVITRTPLVPLHDFSGQTDILLKLEIHQPVTSFKLRGVFYAVAVLTEQQRRQGVSTVSAGNTAQALAWTARFFSISARSLMPDTAPLSKIEAVRRYGGTPVLVPVAEVFRYLQQHGWEQEPYAFIHPWINRDVMTGHGTIALEILADFPEVESVFIPVGGGGLLGGVGTALKLLKPSVRIIAVEPQGCAALHASIQAGKPCSVDCQTICDGVAVPYITEEMYPLLAQLVDKTVLVSEEHVKETIRRLAFGNKIIVEGAGALSIAAAIATPVAERGRSACLVTGGSIDEDKLNAILQKK